MRAIRGYRERALRPCSGRGKMYPFGGLCVEPVRAWMISESTARPDSCAGTRACDHARSDDPGDVAADEVKRILRSIAQVDRRNVALRMDIKTSAARVEVRVVVFRGGKGQCRQRLSGVAAQCVRWPSTACDLDAVANLELVDKAVGAVLIDKLQVRINRRAGVGLAARTAVQHLRPHKGSCLSIDRINLSVEFGDEEQVPHSGRSGDIAQVDRRPIHQRRSFKRKDLLEISYFCSRQN